MMKPEIGKTAGEIWKYLGRNGMVSLTDLPNKVKVNPERLHQAVGWLAREDKVKFTKEGRTTYIALTEPEINNYRETQCQL